MFEMKFKGQIFFLNWGFFNSLEGVQNKLQGNGLARPKNNHVSTYIVISRVEEKISQCVQHT
jgi:hypothetical protein